MLQIYFIRHGQTEWNTQGMMQGRNNSPLTQKGRDQAKKLGEHLKTEEFDVIYSSPLGRAMETTELILGDSKKEILPIDEFKEIAMGKVEGIPKEEFELTYPEEYYNFWHDGTKYDPTAYQGESYEEVLDRAKKGLDKLSKLYSNGKIMVVTHGVMLKAICNVVLEKGISEFTKQPVPENTSVTVINYKDGHFEIEKFSMTDHLK